MVNFMRYIFLNFKKRLKKDNKLNAVLVFLILLLMLIIFISGSFFVYKNKSNFLYDILKQKYDQGFLYSDITNFNPDILKINSDDLNLESESYAVYDFTEDKLILSNNSQKTLPLASISKIMTSYVGIKYCPKVLKKYESTVLINSSNENSENIAINCFGDENKFVDVMNREAKNNNLNLFFANPSGLDIVDGIEASNYGDAISILKLAKIFYFYDDGKTFGITAHKYSDIGVSNTNSYVSKWPFILASKTGYTDLAKGNLLTIYLLNSRIVGIVVLGSTKDGRFSDTEKLLNLYLGR